MTPALVPVQTIPQKHKRARAHFAQIIESEGGLKLNFRNIRTHSFLLGALLLDMKEEIGHGNWTLWIEGNWPDLGERKAQMCMAFYKANPQISSKPWNSTDLRGVGDSEWNSDSFRKLMWGYVPAKERPKLEGDESVSNPPHYLSFVNHFVKWDRQLSLGHVSMPPVAQFRKEMETPLRRIIEIGGKDWAQSLLEL
jgi:hypothetical protein